MSVLRGIDLVEEKGDCHCVKQWYTYMEISKLEGSRVENNWSR